MSIIFVDELVPAPSQRDRLDPSGRPAMSLLGRSAETIAAAAVAGSRR